MNFDELISAAKSDKLSDTQIASLAETLAASGRRLSVSFDRTADVASTGGPGSLSTLLGPLVLAARGLTVIKLGVPGRPAGAIDTLGTLPGYKVNLTELEVQQAAQSSSFAHFLADSTFAPLDAALFAYRQKVGAVAVPPLATASLLSKKIAVGVQNVGLDIRVGPHGNFGATVSSAQVNAEQFCRVARLVGVRATCFIVNAPAPMQPWIGRGESLVALAACAGYNELSSDTWLRDHAIDCFRMGCEMANEPFDPTAFESLRESVGTALARHLASQGASIDRFLDRVENIRKAPRTSARVSSSGSFVVDIGRIRTAIVNANNLNSSESFSDRLGIELLRRPGDQVQAGDEVARVRSSGCSAETLSEVFASFTVGPTVSEGATRTFEVIRG